MNLPISVIIPNFNGQDLLEKYLPSVIKAFKNPENNILEVIIVDDGSKDKSIEIIRQLFPEAKVVKHTKNRGFPAAINTGLRSSKGKLIALINNDVLLAEDCFKRLAEHFKDPKLFAVSLHERGYGWAKGRFEAGYITHSPATEDIQAHPTFWVSGGSGVFRRSLFVKLGSMDEKIFSPFYWEDIDLAYRALKQGYKILWLPDCVVTHEHESTAKTLSKRLRQRIQERNQLLFIWKNLTSQRLLKRHFGGLFMRLIRHPGYVRIVIPALMKLPLVLKARKKLGKLEKVSDEAIFASFE